MPVMPDRSRDGGAARRLDALQAEWGPLSRRAINALSRAGVRPEQLRTLTDAQLRRVRGMGPLTFHEIRTAHPAPSTAAPRPPQPPQPPRAR